MRPELEEVLKKNKIKIVKDRSFKKRKIAKNENDSDLELSGKKLKLAEDGNGFWIYNPEEKHDRKLNKKLSRINRKLNKEAGIIFNIGRQDDLPQKTCPDCGSEFICRPLSGSSSAVKVEMVCSHPKCRKAVMMVKRGGVTVYVDWATGRPISLIPANS